MSMVHNGRSPVGDCRSRMEENEEGEVKEEEWWRGVLQEGEG